MNNTCTHVLYEIISIAMHTPVMQAQLIYKRVMGHTFTHLHTIYAHTYTVSAFINTNTSITGHTSIVRTLHTNIHASLARH